jgi:hypothetical protein|nr:MAG TPA: hypothetical protein [Herelleviridae sp.]
MNYVYVKFNGTEKNYLYKTKLNLIEGATYKIVADGITTYASPVKVCSIVPTRPNFGGVIREITTAEIVTAPPRPKVNVKFIINKEKGTTVAIWKDGSKTIIKCQPGETFDAEKGIAMCFVKRWFKNRGCYNEWMREVLKENGLVEEK